MTADPTKEQLEKEILQHRAMLQALESGELQIGERHSDEPWVERTPAQIDSLRRTIALYQAILERDPYSAHD